ncbi:MAG: hypothetical protein KME17_16335 [Cyanosarcina radialis HA8281-LM2]|nr:hypothetical protein [Cyanosarcina radialis HA8281-LM2]
MLHKLQKTRSIALLVLASAIAGSLLAISARSAQATAVVVPPLYKGKQIFTTQRPDLKIVDLLENGQQATVQIKNQGTGNSPAFKLRAYRWNGVQWISIGQVNINPLAVGATINAVIIAPQIVQFPTKYVVDPDNDVPESRENNNSAYDTPLPR